MKMNNNTDTKITMFVFVGLFIICMAICLYSLLRTTVIVVTSPTTYYVEHYFFWQSYHDSIKMSYGGVYVDNQTNKSLLLNGLVYTDFRYTMDSGEERFIKEFTPHSVTEINSMPDYILQEPPTAIVVKRTKGNNQPEIQTVLRVKKSVHDIFDRK